MDCASSIRARGHGAGHRFLPLRAKMAGRARRVYLDAGDEHGCAHDPRGAAHSDQLDFLFVAGDLDVSLHGSNHRRRAPAPARLRRVVFSRTRLPDQSADQRRSAAQRDRFVRARYPLLEKNAVATAHQRAAVADPGSFTMALLCAMENVRTLGGLFLRSASRLV
jgi:hypothetical protein